MNGTIAAIATGQVTAGVGIVRVSGPDARAIACQLTHSSPDDWKPRQFRRLRVFDPTDGEIIDDGLGVFFPSPRSFTGEDTIELHVHGGATNLGRILRAVLDCGADAARPGEFSERAYVNGKMDLAQAEAVSALIHARTETAARAARRQIDGALGAAIAEVRSPIALALAHIEAAIDYPDDVGDPDPGALKDWIVLARNRARLLLDQARYGRRIAEGAMVVLCGHPNVGKSSLLNRLSGHNRAIVTEHAGTTRDVLREEVVLGGIPVCLVDTAGLRDTDDPVEKIGVDRTGEEMEKADLVVWVTDANPMPGNIPEDLPRAPDLILWNKADLRENSPEPAGLSAPVFEISASTGQGLESLVQWIRERLAPGTGQMESELPLVTQARHENALGAADKALEMAIGSLGTGSPIECVAVDLHDALRRLGEITGDGTREDIIRSIFASFCLGK